MRLPQRLYFTPRFSLSEIMFAVVIDAVLVAALLDSMRALRGDPTHVYDALVLASYVLVPLVVVPLYAITRGARSHAIRRWHTRRNDVLMSLAVVIVLLATVQGHTGPRRRDFGVDLAVSFVPIAFTLFLSNALVVQALRFRARQSSPAVELPHPLDLPRPVAAANEDPGDAVCAGSGRTDGRERSRR